MTFIQNVKNEILGKTKRNEVQNYVADIFLTSATGSIKRGYQVDFFFDDIKDAQNFCEIIAAYDIFPKLTTKRNIIHVYIKSREDICNLLALMGTSKSLLQLNNEIAMRELRSNINRRTNCDTSNIAKQVSTSIQQIRHIKSLNMESLEKGLKQTAIARLENPEDTYEELATKLGVTKSCLVHRLRKIMRTQHEQPQAN